MKYLPLPAGSGDALITRKCRDPDWKTYKGKWLAAAAKYRAVGGDPWKIAPATFTDEQRTKLYGLYDNARKWKSVRDIRRPKPRHRSCPVCGSSSEESVDHALPRKDFPEFSIVHENLVPACTTCNSTEKGGVYKGTLATERLIHPYYDQWATGPLWQVQFGPDLDAAVLTAAPTSSVSAANRATVAFHLRTVLGDGWRESARRLWGDLPAHINRRARGPVTIAGTRQILQERLEDESFEKGENSWAAAFIRGTLADARVPDHLAARANALPRP